VTRKGTAEDIRQGNRGCVGVRVLAGDSVLSTWLCMGREENEKWDADDADEKTQMNADQKKAEDKFRPDNRMTQDKNQSSRPSCDPV
jgi:hypothetical protein